MRTTAVFTFLKHEQPSEAAWIALGEIAKQWNDSHTPKFSDSMSFLWSINFEDQRDQSFSEFLQQLDSLRRNFACKFHATSELIYDEADYLSADFIEILGISLEGFIKRPFILNAGDTLSSPVPCHACGWQDMFSVAQRAPFAIDERLLDLAIPQGGSPPQGGWDCVNLPNGHKLVSRRILSLFEENQVTGFDVLPVLSGTSGKQSQRMFQILARKFVPATVLSNSGAQLSICQVCGAVLDPNVGDHAELASLLTPTTWCVRRKDVAQDEVLSRHPSRGAMLYLSQRVYRLLVGAPLNGIVESTVLALC